MNREEKLALYEKLVATSKRAMSKGASMRYTSANGNMFSFLPKRGNAAIRLPDAARAAFIKKYRAKPSVQFGAVMKDYVEVPEALLKKTAELAKFFALSVEYAYSLVPKATTRNKTEKRQRARDKAARKSAKKTAAKKTAAKKTAAKKTAAKKTAAKKTAAKKTAAKKTATKKTATKKTATKKTAAKKTAAKKTATRAK